jgi:hypothetical protein
MQQVYVSTRASPHPHMHNQNVSKAKQMVASWLAAGPHRPCAVSKRALRPHSLHSFMAAAATHRSCLKVCWQGAKSSITHSPEQLNANTGTPTEKATWPAHQAAN